MGVFLAIALASLDFDELDPRKDLRKPTEQVAWKAKMRQGQTGGEEIHAHKHPEPVMSQEQLQKFRDMVNDLKKQHEEKENGNEEVGR